MYRTYKNEQSRLCNDMQYEERLIPKEVEENNFKIANEDKGDGISVKSSKGILGGLFGNMEIDDIIIIALIILLLSEDCDDNILVVILAALLFLK